MISLVLWIMEVNMLFGSKVGMECKRRQMGGNEVKVRERKERVQIFVWIIKFREGK